MLSVREQIQAKKLVCPETKNPLQWSGQSLVTEDLSRRYELIGESPILLLDPNKTEEYVKGAEQMLREYRESAQKPHLSLWTRLKWDIRKRLNLVGDYRTAASLRAFRAAFDEKEPNSLHLSIGGGPGRPHESFVNINIGPFHNVEIVADAHQLPYADNCVDAIFCEAVLEHLRDPSKAVTEMFRVLKPGGMVYAITPFLQSYHGYPNHFQNYTLTGHTFLFSDRGFVVREAGTCVGPVYTLVELVGRFFQEFLPSPINRIIHRIWSLFGIFIKPLDRLVNQHPNSYILAATVYLLAEKPKPSH